MPNPMLLEEADEDFVEPKGPTFKIFSGALKAFEKEVDGQTRRYLSCTASSTVEDLHGDVMTDDCVMDMAPQAKAKGMTIFLNHSYKWPEDVFGKTTDARIVNRSTNADGKPIYDLDLEIQLNESNERARNSYEAIKEQGIKAGVSIGAMITEWDYRDEDEGFWGGLEIKKVDLLEASIVGIPANQRSWVVNALTALGAPKQIVRKALGMPDTKKDAPKGEPTTKVVEVTNKYLLDGNDITDKLDVVSTQREVEPNADGSFTAQAAPFKSFTVTNGDGEEIITDVEDSAAPADATETPDETDDTPAESTDDGTEKDSPAPEVVAELKAAGLEGDLLEITLGFLEDAAEEVASLRKANADLGEEITDLKRQLNEAAEVVETIARTPLGRKAAFATPVADFRQKFGAIYGEQILNLLSEGDKAE